MVSPRTPDFAKAFRDAAISTLAGSPLLAISPANAQSLIADFADDRGHRRRVDCPFLCWLLRCDPTSLASLPTTAASDCGIDLDVACWLELARRAPLPQRVLEGTGPFLSERDATIEVATEVELSVLHALTNLSRCYDFSSVQRTAAHARATSAARWLLQNLQPDNATNHPWAAHTFALLARDEGFPLRAEASLYAQTLLHNALVPLGRPDHFSALILLDAARVMEQMP